MLNDLTLAVRTLLKRRGYAASVILTLTLGIGGSTMMFSLLDAALLRQMAFADAERLVMLWGVAGPERAVRGASFPEVADWRARNQTLTDVAIYDETSLNLRTGGEAVRVEAEMVSASYFDLLGVRAAVGRTFRPDEDRVPDANPVAVISHDLWHMRFGANAGVIDSAVTLNDRQFVVLGIMPEGFAGISFDTDVWIPSMMVSATGSAGLTQNRGARWLGAIGRIKGGVSREQAQDDLTRVAAGLAQEYPNTNRDRGVQLLGVRESLLGTTAPLISALFGAVMLFLLVACANVSSLQLARATSRGREMALRVALGARRWHVIRQLLAESLVLATVAGVTALLVAAWSLGAVTTFIPAGALPNYVRPALDLRALGFAALVSIACGGAVTLLPALTHRKGDLAESLKEGSRSVPGGLGALRRLSGQQVLVVAEIAAAMTLLTAAGLMARSLERQLDVRIGFEPQGVTVAQVTLPASRYNPAQRLAFVERLTEHLAAIPGVRSAAIGSDIPLNGSSSASILAVVDGPDDGLRYYRHLVTPDYFATLGIPVIRGRGFTLQDRPGTPPVAVVSESGARRMWGTTDVVGRRFRVAPNAPDVTVIGIAGDARHRDLTTDIAAAQAEPDVYFPYAQRSDRDLEIAVRTADGQPVPVQALQQAVAAIDGGLPAYDVQLLADVVAQQTSTSRFGVLLLAIFSGGALLLTAIGLYGLVAYVVGLSRREIAIRLALGSSGSRVVALVVRNGLMLASAGLAIGVLGALAAGRALASQLFETPTADITTLGMVAMTLLMVAVAATLVPVSRATRADPYSALRGD